MVEYVRSSLVLDLEVEVVPMMIEAPSMAYDQLIEPQSPLEII